MERVRTKPSLVWWKPVMSGSKYEHNNSIVSELNLGCESWKPMLVGSIHNAGMVFSMSIAGWIADRFGRKLSMILCSVGGAVGLFKIFLTNYYGYLALEFLETVLASGLYTVGIVIMIEVGGESKRVSTGVIFCYAFYVGEVLFAIIAMGLKYWKYIIMMVYAPMILFLFYVFILRESIRWQIINDRITEVKETLKIIAKMNNLSVTEKEITEITPEELTNKFNAVVQKESENYKHIIASKEMLIRLAVSSFCFFTSGLTYYGMAVHSVLLPGNKYVNFILAALVSFPSDLVALFLMKRFGRKRTLQCGYVCLSVFLVASSFSPENMSLLKIILFLFGKLGTVVCFTSMYTYGLELFPTSVRGTLFGTGNTAARVGSMIAPLTLLLTTTSAALPAIIFSFCALVSAFLLMFTPETKTMPMFDTIAQVDHYMRKSDVTGTDNISFQITENT
ncbi:solute carrier family 22 member 3-like [Aricia agestis]|uniref:solute carrier family 22 member 3-like n=1 Tax=Aricia agestis TaxID=91739 RepID=UPI001C2094E0|nr:solute carrier family 22 member 3-like [Aricia agestis]